MVNILDITHNVLCIYKVIVQYIAAQEKGKFYGFRP